MSEESKNKYRVFMLRFKNTKVQNETKVIKLAYERRLYDKQLGRGIEYQDVSVNKMKSFKGSIYENGLDFHLIFHSHQNF